MCFWSGLVGVTGPRLLEVWNRRVGNLKVRGVPKTEELGLLLSMVGKSE